MNINEVSTLHHGDEVFWADPDKGKCSRYFTINTITIKGDIICISDIDGSCLECFTNELN